jgi:hypothetical protein
MTKENNIKTTKEAEAKTEEKRIRQKAIEELKKCDSFYLVIKNDNEDFTECSMIETCSLIGYLTVFLRKISQERLNRMKEREGGFSGSGERGREIS